MEGSIDDHTMIKLAYYVRKKWLNTKLLSYSDINSGAVDLFLAGVERTMEKGAHIGVHSWSNGFKKAKETVKQENIKTYFNSEIPINDGGLAVGQIGYFLNNF